MNMVADKYCEFWVSRNKAETVSYIKQYIDKLEKKNRECNPPLKEGKKFEYVQKKTEKMKILRDKVAALEPADANKDILPDKFMLRKIIESGLHRKELDQYIWGRPEDVAFELDLLP